MQERRLESSEVLFNKITSEGSPNNQIILIQQIKTIRSIIQAVSLIGVKGVGRRQEEGEKTDKDRTKHRQN